MMVRVERKAKIGVFPMLSHKLWDNININRWT